MNALERRLTNVRMQAASAGATVKRGVEGGIAGALSAAQGYADGRVGTMESTGAQMALLGVGLGARVFAPNGIVKAAGTAAMQSAVDVLGYKIGFMKGMEQATAPK